MRDAREKSIVPFRNGRKECVKVLWSFMDVDMKNVNIDGIGDQSFFYMYVHGAALYYGPIKMLPRNRKFYFKGQSVAD
jgi:hypothetical protein